MVEIVKERERMYRIRSHSHIKEVDWLDELFIIPSIDQPTTYNMTRNSVAIIIIIIIIIAIVIIFSFTYWDSHRRSQSLQRLDHRTFQHIPPAESPSPSLSLYTHSHPANHLPKTVPKWQVAANLLELGQSKHVGLLGEEDSHDQVLHVRWIGQFQQRG